MADRKVAKFLSPAHFEVIPSKKPSTSKPFGGDKKLLTPGEYEKVNFSNKTSKGVGVTKKLDDSQANLECARKEIDCLRDEVKSLKKILENFKEQDVEQREENRKNRDLRAKMAGEAFDLRRLAEIEEENAALQSEIRKQQAIISKLRSDIKQIKLNYEGELEKLDNEVTKYGPVIRHLKQEIKEKDSKYESDLEELQKQLKKQTNELKGLQSELQNAQERIKIDREGFENVISQHEGQKYKDIKSIKDSLNECKIRYSRDVKELSECVVEKEKIIASLRNELNSKEEELDEFKEQAERKEREFLDKMSQHKAQVKTSQESFEATGKELRHALEEAVKSHEKVLEEFREKLHKKDQEIKHEQNTVEQLRVYIGENLPNAQLERVKHENEELKGKMEALMKENETVSSTIEFLKIRLSSLNEILAIQENELNKTMESGQNKVDHLLTKWRQKVFALLVQLKSQEICLENDKNSNKHLVSRLQCELEASRKDLDILSHTLADRNAELQIELNTTKSLRQEIGEKTAVEKNLISSLKSQQDAVVALYEHSFNMAPFLEDLCSNMNEAFVKLGSLSQRVSFAGGRVQFLQGLFAHKEAKWKNELKKVLENQEKPVETQVNETDEERSITSEQLLNEIKRLTQERDMLAVQAVKDAELLDCRVANIRAEYDDKVEESSLRIEQLQCELNDERQRSRSLADKLEVLEANLKESNETVDSLKMDLARHQSETQRSLNRALADEQAKFTEEFAQLEKQLNDVRREHTKTVVALRQAEHQASREKEKAKEQLRLQQKEHDMKLEQLEKKNKSLEKERNMLVTTVRQEGLTVPRTQAKGYASSTDDSDVNHDEKENRIFSAGTSEVKHISRQKTKKGDRTSRSKSHLLKPENTNEGENDGPSHLDAKAMASALYDLKSLSEALLNMKDDEDDL